jgi:hypothetical protein
MALNRMLASLLWNVLGRTILKRVSPRFLAHDVTMMSVFWDAYLYCPPTLRRSFYKARLSKIFLPRYVVIYSVNCPAALWIVSIMLHSMDPKRTREALGFLKRFTMQHSDTRSGTPSLRKQKIPSCLLNSAFF